MAQSRPTPHKYKAGIVLVGDVVGADGVKRLHVLAPWTEGSFSADGKKAYMLAKGTIDKNEDRWQAAIREVGEETGIYLDAIERDERPEAERRYIFNPNSTLHRQWREQGRDCFYEGAEIEKIWREPVVSNVIPSNRGNPAQHDIYLVKVKGIEHLASHLKHKENNIEGDSVKKTASELVQAKVEQGALPSFDDLLQTLRTGWWKWGEDPKWHGKLFDSDFTSHERLYLLEKHGVRSTNEQGQTLFSIDPAIAGCIMDGTLTIRTPEEFDDFYHNYAVSVDVQDDSLKKHVAALRKHLEAMGITNDRTSLKMDTKNAPLRYYQEGADIIPYDTWIDRALAFADQPQNRVYREMQFNNRVNDRRPGRIYDGEGISIGGVMLDVGKILDLAEHHAAKPAAEPHKAGGVVFSAARPITCSMGRVIYSEPLQDAAVQRLHDQVTADRKARGVA